MNNPFSPFNPITKPRSKTSHIIVHGSFTASSETDVDAVTLDTKDRRRGCYCIGFHYVIPRDGTIQRGRPEEAICASSGGYSKQAISICLIGGRSGERSHGKSGWVDNYTDEQKRLLTALLKDILERHPGTPVVGYGDLPGVPSGGPGFAVSELMDTHKEVTTTT